jgi:hypothetical protein
MYKQQPRDDTHTIRRYNSAKQITHSDLAAMKLGFYAAIVTTILTLVTFGIAIFTPPFSGPYCVENCFEYPYTDIVSRFPRDYFWMYPAIFLSLAYYVLMVSIHHLAAPGKKIFSHIGSSFALITAAVLGINYFLQVSVIQPSLLQGETDGIALLSQFNAHGVFIVLEEIGFSMMSLSFLCMAPVFAGSTIERVIRWLFVGGFMLTVLALAAYSIQFGLYREYRFEVATITINWLLLLIAGPMVSVVFRRAMSKATEPGN